MLLIEYFRQVGGRDKIFEKVEDATRHKRLGAASCEPISTKYQLKNGARRVDSISTPAGSWEKEIESVDGCEDEGDGKLVVYLLWKDGKKTKHDTAVVYQKCPQMVRCGQYHHEPWSERLTTKTDAPVLSATHKYHLSYV